MLADGRARQRQLLSRSSSMLTDGRARQNE